jgi:outer membrane protein OmpA-like peptidoglycan-associated protein
MNKTNIYALLGRPHFNEGMWSVREWDYIFNFHKANDTAVEVCQYKVIYTANLLLQSTYWMPESCADWLKLPVPVVIERIVEKPVQVIVEKIVAGPTRVQLSGDGIFEFNKSGIADLRPGGLEKLNRVATELLSSGEIGQINIIGHTDRLGSDAYNLALSLERATTIRQQFIAKGITADHITVYGAGKSAPLVECKQSKRDEALIRCLEPNRRFEIEAWGVLKP